MNSDIETAVPSSLDRASNEAFDAKARPSSIYADTNVVGWQEKDPEHPLNWPSHKRAAHIIIISFMTLTV
jgi:hypothetical protein